MDEPENMQDMDILDMNVLDETENDSGIPADDNLEDEDNCDETEEADVQPEDEDKALEVRNLTLKLSIEVI